MRVPPPLVYVGGVVAGILLHTWVQPVPVPLSLGWRVGVGLAVAALGMVPIGLALGLFRQTRQDPKPWQPTPEIISTGIYRVTRNPMYVGMALLQAAIGIGLGNAWIVVLVAPVVAIVHVTAVRPEEAYLDEKFGEVYREYARTVRRWL